MERGLYAQEAPLERRFRKHGFPYYHTVNAIFEVKRAGEIIFDDKPGYFPHDPIEVDDDGQ